MTNTRNLRIAAFNNWPAKTRFPIESQYLELLARENVQSPIAHCEIQGIDDKEFHHFLAYILDGLDALPMRPDWAFESFYIPLEIEMNRIKGAGNANLSRFIHFKAFLSTLDQYIIDSLAKLVSLAPLQICEFAANRMLEAYTRRSNNDEMLLKRAKDAFGSDFFDAFFVKYCPGYNSPLNEDKSANQRKAGSLIQLILKGVAVVVSGQHCQATEVERIGILSTLILPSMRNDRFHGSVFPSFRSSSYQLKHYAGSQFASTTTLMLVLTSISERWPTCISAVTTADTVQRNVELFQRLFARQIGK